MKKVLVLVLVLGLATVSNAALQLTINGSAATSAISTGLTGSVGVGITMTDNLSQGTFLDYETAAAKDVSYTITGPTLVLPAAGNLASIDAGGISGTAWEYGITIANSTGYVSAPGQVVNSTVTGTGQAYVLTVNLWDNAGENIVDTATVSFVPEPITMALLGLGGLFIRRRTA